VRIKNQKDFWAGAMFLAFGSFFVGFGTQYALGTGANMGPGYFPTAVGSVLGLLGLALTMTSLSAKAMEERIAKFSWPTLLLIIGPVVLFGLMLQPLGLILSLVMLVITSSYASHEFAWRPTLLNAVVLTVLCIVVFVWALKLQFPLWPAFIGDGG